MCLPPTRRAGKYLIMADNLQAVAIFGVFTTDAELKITVWDAALVRFTGVSAEQARGKRLQQLFPEVEKRGLVKKLESVLNNGTVEVLSAAFHNYLIPCPPQTSTTRFDRMLQRTTIAPVLENDRIAGVLVTIEDVTERVEHERQLAELINDPDPETRLRATETLANVADVENELGLVEAVGDSDWRVRQIAVQGLARRSAPEAIHALLGMLRDDHHNLAILNSALQVLAMVDVQTLPTLIEFLHDDDPDLRMQAALALGEQRDQAAVPALLEALEDPGFNVRFHAIEALGKLRDVAAVEPLLRIAESEDFFLAFPALESLRQIGEPKGAARLIELLTVESLRDAAAETLGVLGDESVVPSLAALLNSEASAALPVASALTALYYRFEKEHGEGDFIADLSRQSIQPSGVQHLMAALNEVEPENLRPLALVIGWLRGAAVDRMLVRLLGEPTVRNEVLEALTHHGEGVLDLLIERINSEDVETRRAAVIVLGRLGYRRATAALTTVLGTDDSLRVEAANALARIGDEAALDPLLNMIGNPDGTVRQAVVGALNSIGSAKMPPRIKPLLEDSDPLVRESAAKIAGYFGYENCAELLLQCSSDEDERVRKAAVEHLPYLDDERTSTVLAEILKSDTPRVRAAAAFAMRNVAGSGVELIAALKDQDPWVRYFAARSLGSLADPNSIPALVDLVNRDPLNHVRIAALEALGKIGGTPAENTIRTYLGSEDRDVARVAAQALERATKRKVD